MSTRSDPSPSAGTTSNLNAGPDLKQSEPTTTPAKPCCVCKDEKAARDECMLFSDGDPQESCRSMIEQYRSCMAGYGFELPGVPQ